MSVGVAGLAVVVMLVVAVTVPAVTRAVVRYDLGKRVDELTVELADWRGRHVDRIVNLGKQMSRVERAVARAEDEARRASLAMEQLSRDIVRRMEAVEKDMEIGILVAQGRIPKEHRRDPEPEW
jgi:hypothetical protein